MREERNKTKKKNLCDIAALSHTIKYTILLIFFYKYK